MNEALRLTALFIRDLLDYDEQLIRIGRQNTDIEDFTIAYIGVDSLSPATRIAYGRSFDGENEIENIAQRWSAPVVIWFYGNGAWDRASEYSAMIQTEKANQLQAQYGISVFLAASMMDTKILAGEQYGERIEMQATVHYTTQIDVDTLRIDEAVLVMQDEDGIFYDNR